LTELSHKNPSKLTEAMAIEVNLLLSFLSMANTVLYTETSVETCRYCLEAWCHWPLLSTWWFYAINIKCWACPNPGA